MFCRANSRTFSLTDHSRWPQTSLTSAPCAVRCLESLPLLERRALPEGILLITSTLNPGDRSIMLRTTVTKRLLTLIASGFCLLPSAFAQNGGAGGEAVALAAEEPAEEGIPVTDPLVISRCGTCHTKDAKNNLSRISWERTTPEGWEQAIKRMVRLNGMTITP